MRISDWSSDVCSSDLVATLLLAGVAVNAMAGAGIGFMVFLSDDQQLRALNYWLLGSLGGVTWGSMALAAPLILVGPVLLPLFARHLNALLLGASEAVPPGFPVERSNPAIAVLAALAPVPALALTGGLGSVAPSIQHRGRPTPPP